MTSRLIFAQTGFNYFKTPVGDLNEWRTLMANPSIGPFQNAAIEAGVKVWNYGFLDDDVMALKTGFFALNLPRFLFWGTTIGATGQYFSSPYMAENELNFLVSNHFWGIVSMGVGVGLYNRSYDQSRFDLVDADDPV
ncbi:MAG TPA: hypothetical protein ENK44_13740, partial [Caldithrix abyssi]|nr:hypothetical protein [Caldithrix abyssi]